MLGIGCQLPGMYHSHSRWLAVMASWSSIAGLPLLLGGHLETSEIETFSASEYGSSWVTSSLVEVFRCKPPCQSFAFTHVVCRPSSHLPVHHSFLWVNIRPSTHPPFHPLIGQGFGLMVAPVDSFLTNRAWAWRTKGPPSWHSELQTEDD